jgi:hypothetical protein
MVLCGALKAPDQWQKHHEPGPKLALLKDQLSQALHRTGTLEWRSPAGQALVDDMRAEYRSRLGGYVNELSANEMLAAADEGHLSAAIPAVEEDEPMNALEALLQEHKKRMEKSAMGTTLATLLD